MKLWDKGIETDKKIELFTVGEDRNLDIYLAKWDVIGSLAHTRMLAEIGLLTAEELDVIQKELITLLNDHILSDDFEIEEGVEDIHSQVELHLTRKLGDIGKKIHSGRSRNDQVLVDLRLYFRDQITEISSKASSLFDVLIHKADQYKDVLMPGYTHMQVAMPSSFGLWFSSFAESLAEDMYSLEAAWRICDQNPLGSAAGYGSSFPLDRQMTTQLLGFSTLSYNSISAQMGRGKTEKYLANAMASVASTLNKLSSDICLYNGQNFGFFKLPEELTTGSSIMPHKTNPDVFEVMRGRTNRIQALPNTLTVLLTNLQAGYHRDLQLTKEEIVPRIEELKDCLDMCIYAFEKIEVNEELLENSTYDHLFTVEEVNREVLKGVPFRDAYKKIGQRIKDGTYSPQKDIHHTHEGSIGNLCLPEIATKFKSSLKRMDFEKVNKAVNELVNS